MNPARENILARVRAALRTPAPQPPPPSTAPVFPPVTDLEARFRAELTALRGELVESAEALRALLAGFPKYATDGSELVSQAAGTGTASVRECDLGVSACECLIAQTGSVVVSPRVTGGRAPQPHAAGRAISVLPPVHLVVARRDQLVPDLAAALALLRQRYNNHWPSTLSVITGPSRTADIEKILVLGAHGPKRLLVYFAG